MNRLLAGKTHIIAVLLLVACSRATTPDVSPDQRADPQGDAVSSSLIGVWTLRREPSPRTPFFLDLSVDSVVGSMAFGRITRYFAGDMGGNVANWRGFQADLSDETIAIEVKHRGLGDTVFYMEGVRHTNTIELSRFRVSGANLTNDEVSWSLVRTGDR